MEQLTSSSSLDKLMERNVAGDSPQKRGREGTDDNYAALELYNLLRMFKDQPRGAFQGDAASYESPDRDENKEGKLVRKDNAYTAAVQQRQFADHFDFALPQPDTSQGVPGKEDASSQRTLKNLLNPDLEAESASESDDSETEERSSNDIQNIIDQILVFKTEFRELITKIDAASTDAAVSGYIENRFRPNRIVETEVGGGSVMSNVIDSVVNLLHEMLPNNERNKRIKEDTSASWEPSSKKPKLDSESGAIVAKRQFSQPRARTLGSFTHLEDDDPCCVLPNFGVLLVKSPTMVSQLWDEYTKVPSQWALKDLLSLSLEQRENNVDLKLIRSRKTSIRELERKYGSSWRNNDKNFSRQINRRKKIWNAIEDGLRDGLELEECFQILESYSKRRGKGLSWYYNGVPFRLKDARNDSSNVS
ncbi:HDL491Wp [Eremothecium sinecaudum]|uniref:HDL491Wp n=1 Tax=Eremothecium sinecaudum TaxID=45286 RepID=A0A109UZG2_9SACH|nr:HDL491Wp [Eremothecium sinecaudum]AMD20253.1 HDL491Wp [Eremothecium sinecaudum]